jgi:small subunit ribosomal protein S7
MEKRASLKGYAHQFSDLNCFLFLGSFSAGRMLTTSSQNMSIILAHLRTAPSPTPDPRRPLLPGSPPTSQLPLNPILYLALAIDSIAPLLRIRTQKGAAGGGVALQIPVPLGLRQRRRRAIQWILDAAEKRPFRGSGRGGFAQRVAEEVIAVVEGRSSIWEKRNAVHKLGVAARATVLMPSRRR